MTEQEFDPHGDGSRPEGSTTTAGQTAGGTASQPAVLGPFPLRDVVVLASVLVMLVGSLLPIVRSSRGPNLWNGASLFFIGIGIVLPLVVAGLFLARRLAPKTSGSGMRIGSLSLDQFASVVAAFAAAFFFLSTVAGYSLGFLVALIGSLGLLVSTVLAPMLPFFAADFAGRVEVPAHPVARQAHAAVAKPVLSKTAGGKVGDRKAKERKTPGRTAPSAGATQGGQQASQPIGQQTGSGPAAAWSAAAEQQKLAYEASPIPSPQWGGQPPSYQPADNEPAQHSAGYQPAGNQAEYLPPQERELQQAGNQTEYLPPQEPELQQAGNQADYQSVAQPQHQEASNLEPRKSARAPEQAEPEDREPGFDQPVQEPAAAPELSQYLGTAAAAGGVGSAATALPAEGQTAWGTQPEAGQHGEQQHAGADQLPDADSASYFDRGEETLLHPAIHDAAEPPAGAGHGDQTPAAHDARPAGQAPAAEAGYAAGQAARQAASQPPTAIHETVRRQPESIGATVDPATRQQQPTGFGHEEADRPVYDAFWFAVDRPRAVVDEKTGGFLYNLEPGNWILALQDRGHDFLVQNTDGRVGVLRDLSNIERAPEGE